MRRGILLPSLGLRFLPKRSLGQNFLINQGAAQRIAQNLELGPQDVVVEIGPGSGILTKELLSYGAQVIGVEIDSRLCRILRENLKSERLLVFCEDFLRFDLSLWGENLKLVGNIPYHLTSPVIEKLINQRERIELIVLTLQKEVARRICSPPGRKDFSSLSVISQLYFHPHKLFDLSPSSFRPKPKVEATVLGLKVRKKLAVPIPDELFFRKVVRGAFGKRRKIIKNALKGLLPQGKEDEVFSRAGVDPCLRGEALNLEDFSRLSMVLWEYLHRDDSSPPKTRTDKEMVND